MKVFDVFLHAGSRREHDLIELRVRTLSKAVDDQVGVHATLTHQGEPAPDYDVPRWPDGIAMVDSMVVDVTPIPDGGRGGMDSPYPFWVEAQHRNTATQAADSRGADPDDIILVSDIDEIPDPATLEAIVEGVELHGVVSVPMRMHGFALDYLYPLPWRGTTASRRRFLAPQDYRNRRGAFPAAGSGWHFSWFGTDVDRQAKLDSFSHAELRGTLDVAAAYRTGVHANGEQLRRLTLAEMEKLRWPEPMVDGSWTPPASWYAPRDGGGDG